MQGGGGEQGHLQERVMTLEAAAHCYWEAGRGRGLVQGVLLPL